MKSFAFHGHPGTHAGCSPGAHAAYGGAIHQQHLLLHDTQIHTMRADEQVAHELQAVQVGQQTHVLLMAGCIH